MFVCERKELQEEGRENLLQENLPEPVQSENRRQEIRVSLLPQEMQQMFCGPNLITECGPEYVPLPNPVCVSQYVPLSIPLVVSEWVPVPIPLDVSEWVPLPKPLRVSNRQFIPIFSSNRFSKPEPQPNIQRRNQISQSKSNRNTGSHHRHTRSFWKWYYSRTSRGIVCSCHIINRRRKEKAGKHTHGYGRSNEPSLYRWYRR